MNFNNLLINFAILMFAVHVQFLYRRLLIMLIWLLLELVIIWLIENMTGFFDCLNGFGED